MSRTSGLGGAESVRASAATARAEILPLVAGRLERVEVLFRENLASPIRIILETAVDAPP